MRMRGTAGFVAGSLAGALVATTLTAAGMALADARGSTTVHACAARTGGALRLATHCKASERAVSWSVQGPRGPRGRTGASGAGPAYISRVPDATPVGSGPLTEVASLTLPPGDYLVTATATASSPAATDNGSCEIAGGGEFGEAASFSITSSHGEALAVTGLAQATSVDDVVKLLCGGQTSVSIAQSVLTAVQVQSVADQSP